MGYVPDVVWHDSSARSREIGEQLRKRRVAAGIGASELANRLGWSPSKVSRIESGQIGVSERDATIYLAVCGVLKDELTELLDLVNAGSSTSWLQQFGNQVPDEMRTLIHHEATARTIASYEPTLVPGLLQTEGYARALIRHAGFITEDKIGHAIDARMARQEVMRRPNPPDCVFFLHEFGLRSQVGSNKIMHEQMLQLVFLTSRPQHQIRVLPAAEPQGAWGGMFLRMDFAHHNPMVFVETPTSGLFLEKPGEVAFYRQALSRLDRAALDEGQSRQLLMQLASDFDRPEGS